MMLDLKRFSWLVAVPLLALAFPLEVLFFKPAMALLAYVPVCLIFALPEKGRAKAPARLAALDVGVALYSALIAAHIAVSLLVGEFSMLEALRNAFLFLVPVSFYVYVSRFAHDSEFKPLFAGIVLAALIVGLYFAYDSFAKIVWHQTGAYQVRAQAYSAARMGLRPDQMNQFRVNVGTRSMGLLERHTVSGAWIGLGAFASFALLAGRSPAVRVAAGLGWLILLLAGLNMTSVLGFVFVALLVYVWPATGVSALRRLGRVRFAQKVSDRQAAIAIALATAAAAAVVVWFADPALVYPVKRFKDFVWSIVVLELSKIFSVNTHYDLANLTFIAWTLAALKSYAGAVARHPAVLFFGTGPAMTADFLRGGDTGFLETLGLMGLPLFALVVGGIVTTARKVLKDLRSDGAGRRAHLEFGLAVVLFVAVYEAHYSVWASKSILPIVFIALGLLRRYRSASK